MKITVLLSIFIGLCLLVACQKEAALPVDVITTKIDVTEDPVLSFITQLTKIIPVTIGIRLDKTSASTSTKDLPLQIHCESGTCLEVVPSLLQPYQQRANVICQDVEVAICCCMSTGASQCFDFRLSPQNACREIEVVETIPPVKIKMVALDSII